MSRQRAEPAGDPPARRPEGDDPSGLTRHRFIIVALTVLSLVMAWVYMTGISATDPWYRNTDMNIQNTVDALAINAGIAPSHFDQPGLPSKYLLSLDFRIRHYLGLLTVWNLKRLDGSPEPLREIPELIRLGRVHSRLEVMAFILSAAGLIYVIARNFEAACLAVVLLCGSSGLLFHGLLTRPELLCAWLGLVPALFCLWRATALRSGFRRHGWLLLSGLFAGLSILAKLPGMFYLVMCYAWCWLAAWTDGAGSAPAATPGLRGGLWAAASGAMILGLMIHLAGLSDAIGPVALVRIRLAAGVVALLPLLALWPEPNPAVRFLLERCRELVLLGGGALVAIGLSYVALRAVLTDPNASNYLAGVLQFVFDPGPTMKNILTAEPDLGRELARFFKETPLLLTTGLGLVLGFRWIRLTPPRLRAFIGLLVGTGLGMTLLMSRRYFFYPYLIFTQVPLLLAWPLILFGAGAWRPRTSPAEGVHWTVPLSMAAAFALMLTGYFRLQPKYRDYQSDAGLPVSELTLTQLFDHDVLPLRYRQIMANRYGDRKHFALVLELYLANPDNRY